MDTSLGITLLKQFGDIGCWGSGQKLSEFEGMFGGLLCAFSEVMFKAIVFMVIASPDDNISGCHVDFFKQIAVFSFICRTSMVDAELFNP